MIKNKILIIKGRTFEEVYLSPENYSYVQYNDAKPEGSVGSDSK
jgi:hypothetical protein